MRMLVVEDEKKMAAYLRRAFTEEGHAVEEAYDGEEALALALSQPYDAIVLDLNLPRRNGLSVLRQLGASGRAIPLLILSARGQADDRIAGLNLGADDYLPKPFSLEELIARVRALGRRAGESKAITLRVGDLTLDTITREVRRGATLIDLAPREYLLLEFLMRAPGRIRGRMAIVEKVWDYDFDPGTNLVDVYIMRLREKIDAGFEVKLLQTVRGVGYVLREPA